MGGLRIAALSDLHIEFDREIVRSGDKTKKSALRKAVEAEGHPAVGPNLAPLQGACDVLVLAGDVDLGTHAIAYAARVAEWLSVPVVLVAGNHEFYGGAHRETLAALRHEAQRFPDIHFLENDRLDVTIDGRLVRFLGGTLWTDFALFGADVRDDAMTLCGRRMTDFNGTVRLSGFEIFSPEHSLELHKRSRAWIEGELANSRDATTVVVTHHAPSYRSVASEYRKDLVSAAYASRLDGLLESQAVALWIHGHIHTSSDYVHAGTRVICNPRGYRPFELNKWFDPGLVTVV